NKLMLSIAAGADGAAIQKSIEENDKAEKAAVSRDRVLELLTESFAAVRKAMQDATGGSLSRDIDFFGTKTTMRGVLTEVDTHIAEHMGQAIAYARVNGIVPPWSK
ncbi:MAG TPA: DinB family protein, partial [Candidatus Acidoferrum sp.]|nr:DinB family protein [Candidatus Acidoferrum sp.]